MSEYEYEYNEKYWIINLSSNSPKFLLNFVNLLKFPNLFNIKSSMIRIKKKKTRPVLYGAG